MRQVAWSAYAAPCVATFRGDNGGATAPGVTRSTITLTYRKANAAQQAALSAAVGAADIPDADYLADLQTYVDLFNKEYELYGRRVVVRPYDGKGDYLNEVQGQGTDEAQADAASARQLGAFGDVTFWGYGFQPYWESLVAEKILTFSPLYMPPEWFRAQAPFAWGTVWPMGVDAAHAVGAVACRRMAHLPAQFAGDAAMARQQRVFGIANPENPVYKQIGDVIDAALRRCGAPPAKRVNFAVNFASYPSEAASVAAQMKAAGVTTFICGCDPVLPIFLSRSADSQQYRPEWLTLGWGDAFPREYSADQWSHAFAVGSATRPRSESEAFRAFQLAARGRQPAESHFADAYYTLLHVFNGVQAAGPRLTPAAFERAMFSLPAAAGDVGLLRFGDAVYDPYRDTQVLAWDPTVVSDLDAKRGAWRACEGGRRLPYADAASYGTPGEQLRCFDR